MFKVCNRVKWTIIGHSYVGHTPHDCRHTGISLLDSAGANLLCIKRIVGHSAQDITGDVYTHNTIKELIAAIDLI